MSIEKHLQFLGQNVQDVVTGMIGMVDSISFDAYGCVQATVRARIKEDGTIPECRWFDVKRLKPHGERIMDVPTFGEPGTEPGPADKPARG